MNKKLFPLVLLAVGQTTQAVELPSAGSQLQQIPATPTRERAAPQVQVSPRSSTPAAPSDRATLRVDTLHIANAKAFSEIELVAASGFKPGTQLTLAELQGVAAKIANYYRSKGYFLADASLPAQEVVDGSVTIVVTEGQYGKVVVRNQSGLSESVTDRVLDGLSAGDSITIAPLESRLLQLADVPGVAVRSTLVPGASVGASDLIVDVTRAQAWTGSVDMDNSGNRYTGAQRFGGTVNLNNGAGLGDVASLRALSSFDGLDYGRASYQMLVGRADVGVAYTAMHYELGKEFDALDAHGTARIASVYGRYPLIRSRAGNLYAQFDFDSKKFRDQIDASGAATGVDKKANVALLSLVGDSRDGFASGGAMSYSVTWSTGSLNLQNPIANAADAAAARSDGHYDKFGLSAMRLQRVTDSLSLYLGLQGQLAAGNLDVSEKIGLGGAGGVRAYPEGEAYVDQGYVINVEGRQTLPKLLDLMPGQFQAVVFFDSGSGRPNRNAWDADNARRTLSGAGLGLNWFAASFSVKASYAHKVGATAATSAPDADHRFWINASKYF